MVLRQNDSLDEAMGITAPDGLCLELRLLRGLPDEPTQREISDALTNGARQSPSRRFPSASTAATGSSSRSAGRQYLRRQGRGHPLLRPSLEGQGLSVQRQAAEGEHRGPAEIHAKRRTGKSAPPTRAAAASLAPSPAKVVKPAEPAPVPPPAVPVSPEDVLAVAAELASVCGNVSLVSVIGPAAEALHRAGR